MVQIVENPRVRRGREGSDRAGGDVVIAEHRDVAGCEGHVRKNTVEVHRNGRPPDGVAVERIVEWRYVSVSSSSSSLTSAKTPAMIPESSATVLRKNSRSRRRPLIRSALAGVLVEERFGALRVAVRGTPDEGEVVGRFEAGAGVFEVVAAFEIEKARGGVRPHGARIRIGGSALGLE